MEPTSLNSVFNLKFRDKFGFNLKEKQLEIISAFLKGKNAMGIFPTAFGKSMFFF
jgi:superfamily II DNA helicase RecQ